MNTGEHASSVKATSNQDHPPFAGVDDHNKFKHFVHHSNEVAQTSDQSPKRNSESEHQNQSSGSSRNGGHDLVVPPHEANTHTHSHR